MKYTKIVHVFMSVFVGKTTSTKAVKNGTASQYNNQNYQTFIFSHVGLNSLEKWIFYGLFQC